MKLKELFSEWLDLKELALGSLVAAVNILLLASRAYTRHDPMYFWGIAVSAGLLIIAQLCALHVIKKYKNNG